MILVADKKLNKLINHNTLWPYYLIALLPLINYLLLKNER